MYLLEQNYRSTQTIVEAANTVIKNNSKQFDKTAFSEASKGAPILSISTQSREEESNMVARAIQGYVQKGYDYKDIAILYRASYLSRQMEQSLLRYDIPYKMIRGLSFYERKEIKDIISFLRYMYNPSDLMAFSRIANVPKRGIGKTTLDKIYACFFENSGGIIEIEKLVMEPDFLPKNSKVKSNLKQFFAMINALRERINLCTPSELIRELIAVINYEEYLQELEPASFEDRMQNIEELLELASRYPTLEDLLESFCFTAENSDECEGEDNAVSMLTIHGSKGLEWPVVIIISCAEGIIPFYKATQKEEIEEERRLFYVGMTRAKDQLLLTMHKTAFQLGALRKYKTSRFVGEISAEFIQKA